LVSVADRLPVARSRPAEVAEQHLREEREPMNKTVILLHGLARTRYSMSLLGWGLARRGYAVLNFGYPSRHETIADHADRLRRFVLERGPTQPLNFVTHSLGSIVVRLFALRYHAEFLLDRVVMLGPPNNGAALALGLHRHAPIVGRFMGPAFTEIAHLNLPPATDHLEVGVIAGSLGERTRLLPFVSPPNDGIVSVSETHLPGCRDAIVVPGLHSWMMYQPGVLRLITAFLETGEFSRTVD